jgi:predicted metal-binding protein
VLTSLIMPQPNDCSVFAAHGKKRKLDNSFVFVCKTCEDVYQRDRTFKSESGFYKHVNKKHLKE